MKSARRGRTSDASSHKQSDGGGTYGKFATSVKHTALREFAKRFRDCDEFISHAQEWLLGKLSIPGDQFREPFPLDELRQLDYALEGVVFQQLLRMPYTSSNPSSAAETSLAVEDFLHSASQTLWETLWSSEDRMPFFVTGPRGKRSHLDGVALVGKSGRGMHTVWEHVVEFVEVQAEVGGEALTSVIGRALFHGLHMLMSRLYSEKKPSVRRHLDTAYVVFVDSKCGGVVKLRGDVGKLETKPGSLTYEAAVTWLETQADVSVSSVEQVWNRFGNANWGDAGALQLLLATLHCIEQCRGSPRRPLAELAAEHGGRLNRRKLERRFLEIQENGVLQQAEQSFRQEMTQEIQEIEEIEAQEIMREFEALKLEPGSTLWLEDAHWQRGFRIQSSLGDDKHSVYSAAALDEEKGSGGKPLAVYIGAHPSQLEPSWEDMTSWYQVQRQSRVLNTMKQRSVSSKHLPQLHSCGRILHSGSCSRDSPSGRCDHPWCGIPVLVTAPLGEPLDVVVAKNGWVSSSEALRCCHDLLSALRSANTAGIQHGDISPQHVVRVRGGESEFFYVLVDWGRAVIEERDSPAVSSRFSSTYALQEGKVCPAADAESVVYLMFYLVGGSIPEFESIEAAVQWRERAWGLRTFQMVLGEVSAVLKAYADYIDGLIGTPYAADYDIWLRRMSRAWSQSCSSSSSVASLDQHQQQQQQIQSYQQGQSYQQQQQMGEMHESSSSNLGKRVMQMPGQYQLEATSNNSSSRPDYNAESSGTSGTS